MHHISLLHRTATLIALYVLAIVTLLGTTLFFSSPVKAADLHQSEPNQDPGQSMLSAVAAGASDQNVQAAFTGCAGPMLSPTDANWEQRVAELTNIERAKVGLPPLKFEATLAAAIRYHVTDMAQDNYFQHATFDRNGSDLYQVCEWSERVWAYVPDAGSIAENIGVGNVSPEAAVQAWMESEGHRNNILGNYSELGVGYYDERWGQNFSKRFDTYPVIINGEAGATDTTAVTLYAYGDWQNVRLRNDGGTWSDWRPFSNRMDWQINAISGTRTLDIELSEGVHTTISSDTIRYTGIEQPAPDISPGNNVRIYMPLVSGR